MQRGHQARAVVKSSIVLACAIFLLVLLLFLAVPGRAETVADCETSLPIESLPPWMERFHLSVSSSLLAMSQGLDTFFVADGINDFAQNRTRLQARLGAQVDTEGHAVFLQRFYARLDLPKIEERLSLFFDQTSDDEEEEDEKLFTATPHRTSTNLRFGTTTGLRFVLSRSDWHLAQFRVGATLLPRWQRFSELSGQLRLPFGEFLLRPSQFLFWRDRDGLGETTRIDLDYQFGPRTLLRWREEGTLSEASSGFEYRNALYLVQEVGNAPAGKKLLVSLESDGRTRSTDKLFRYLAGFSWRQLLYGEWLFIESGCNVTFREERNFRGVPAVFLLLEANFDCASATTALKSRDPDLDSVRTDPEIIRK